VIALLLQWTQSVSEVELYHFKRGREDEEGKGQQDGKVCLSMYSITENIFSVLILTQPVTF
jgi:hypothetical protein